MIQHSEKILITGCGGMLGEAVYARFRDRCRVFASDIDLNEPWLEYLDVADPTAVSAYAERICPDYIVHLAALTDMEYCELHPEHAHAVNTQGVEHLAAYARQHDIPFVYISTAGIFDGTQDGYSEDDQPNPQSVYGKSKYAGEMIARSLPKSIVVRAGWMMGGGPRKDKKFVHKLIKQLRVGAKKIAVVDDKLGTPCYTYDLARVIEHLLDNQVCGIFHGACRGGGSRYDVAKLICTILGRHDVALEIVDSSYFHENYFAPRPHSEKLIDTKLAHLDLTRDWRICLAEYLNKFDWHLQGLATSGINRNFYKDYFEFEAGHWLMRGRRDMLKRLIARHASPHAKILDMACGVGTTVAELAAAGHDVSGVDVSAEAVRLGLLRGVNGISFLDTDRTAHGDGAFDVVLMVDFLEHLRDEAWALREAYRVLRPGGVAIVVTPACPWLWGVHDEISQHFRRYTMYQLQAVATSAAPFSVLRASYFNSLLFLPIAAFRLVRKFLGIRTTKSDFSINSRVFDAILSGAFALERKTLDHLDLPVGVSALLILQRP